MKLTLTKIKIDPVITEYGSNRVGIQTKEYNGKWLSGFVKDCKWKEGDELELDVVESDKKDRNGQNYLNYKFPKKDTNPGTAQILLHIDNIEMLLKKKIDELEKRTKELEGFKDDYMKGKSIANFNRTRPEQDKIDLEDYPDFDKEAMEAMAKDDYEDY